MWEFFIALFGGAYYGGRYFAEKSLDSPSVKYQKKFELWKQKTIDENIEAEMCAFMEQATADEITNALSKIGWNGEMSPDPERYKEDTLRLLMSSKGKLLRKDAIHGIPSHSQKYAKTKEEALVNVRSYNIAMFIHTQLKRYGIIEPMYVGKRSFYLPLDENSFFMPGCYVWEPMLRSSGISPKTTPDGRIRLGLEIPLSISGSDVQR